MAGGHSSSSPPGSPSRTAGSFSRVLTFAREHSIPHPHQHALQVFKARIAEQRLAVPPAMLYNNDLDAMCVRFLRARKWNVDAAMQMLVKSLEWRKKVGADTALTDPMDPRLVQLIRHCRPSSYIGFDHEGHPIFVERLGKLDGARIEKEEISDEQILKYHLREMEFMGEVFNKTSSEHGHTIDRVVSIMDAAGLTLSALTGYTTKLFRLITSMDSDNYPESCHAIYIMNGGMAFGAVWRIVSHFVDKGTRDKVHVVSHAKTKHVLAKACGGIDKVPDFLGGGLDYEATKGAWLADMDCIMAGKAAAAAAAKEKETAAAKEKEAAAAASNDAPPAGEGLVGNGVGAAAAAEPAAEVEIDATDERSVPKGSAAAPTIAAAAAVGALTAGAVVAGTTQSARAGEEQVGADSTGRHAAAHSVEPVNAAEEVQSQPAAAEVAPQGPGASADRMSPSKAAATAAFRAALLEPPKGLAGIKARKESVTESFGDADEFCTPKSHMSQMSRASFASGISMYHDAIDGASPHWLQPGNSSSGSGTADSPRAALPEGSSSYNGPALTADTLARAAAADREATMQGAWPSPSTSRFAPMGRGRDLAVADGPGVDAAGVPAVPAAAAGQPEGGGEHSPVERGVPDGAIAAVAPPDSADSAAAVGPAAAAGVVPVTAVRSGAASGVWSGAATPIVASPRADSAGGVTDAPRPSGATTPVKGFRGSDGDTTVPPSPGATHAATHGSFVGSAAGLSDHGSFCSSGRHTGGRAGVGLSAVDEPGDGHQPKCACRCVIS